MSREVEYLIYRWEECLGDVEIKPHRREFIKTESFPPSGILAEVEKALEAYPAGKYRAVPAGTMIDFEVKATVVLS